MKKNWKKIGLILLFDVLFILLIYNLRFVSANVNGWFFVQFYKINSALRIASILLLAIIEILALVAIYSFFKYLVLVNVNEIFKKTELRLNRFFSFLKLNWIIASPMTILYMVLSIAILTYLGKKAVSGVSSPSAFLFPLLVIIVIIVVLLIYLYTLLNLAHNIFLKEKSLKKMIKQTFISSFKFDTYRIYWHNIKILLVFSVSLLIFYAFMKLFILTSITDYLKYGGIYRNGLYLIAFIAGYFLLLFNRINFYKKFAKT